MQLSGWSRRTIFDILGCHQDYGTFRNPPARPTGQHRVLNDNDRDFICGLIATQPTIFLDEIQYELEFFFFFFYIMFICL
jgi:hypothetical protein